MRVCQAQTFKSQFYTYIIYTENGLIFKERHKLLLVEESEEQEISPLLDLRYNIELLDPLFIIGEIMKMKKKNWDKYPFTIHLAKGTCIEKT